MTAEEFLESKGLITNVYFVDTRLEYIVEAMEEYAQLKIRELNDFTESNKSSYNPPSE